MRPCARPAATSRRRRACSASSARLLPPSSGDAAGLRRPAQAGTTNREAFIPMVEQSARLPQIMVVDDDADTVSILARHLQREGFVPIEAISGAECLRLARE